MPNLPTSQHLLCRTATTPLLVALVVLFLLGPPPGPAFAQDDAAETENSEQTDLQESTSAEGASDDLSGRSAGSGAVEVGDGEVGDGEVGDGEVVAGDVYAGNGCVKAGDVTVGDCGEERGGPQSDDPGNGGSNEASDDEGSPAEDESTAPETTAEEPVSEETTSEETTLHETTLEDTTLEERTLLEETTGGDTTSSPSPAPEEGEVCPTAPPEDAIEAEIEGTADGDTLALAETVEGYDTVRLIGVDTPELEGEDGQPEPFAEEASDFTAKELENQKVLLQVGEEEADQYGRLLAYVWTAPEDGFVGGLKRMVGMGEAELFNLTLLEEGYARVLTIEPNDLHADCFESAEAEARDAGVGLWAGNEGAGGSSDDQYDEETPPETPAEASPPGETAPDTEPAEASPAPEDDSAAPEPERQPSAAEDQYEQSPPPEPEVQEEEIQEPEVQEPEIQESVAPSGGGEAAVLETSASPATSASPEPVETLPAGTASTAPVSVLPETGGAPLPAPGAGLAAVGLVGGAALGFLAVRSFLRRGVPGGR